MFLERLYQRAIQHEWYLEMVKMQRTHPHKTVNERKNSERGFILPTVMLLTAALTVIGIALMSSASSQYKLTSDNIYAQNALLAAEAGVEQSINALNESETFNGYPTEQAFINDPTQGIGRFKTTIENDPNGTNSKIITSTGYAYRHNDLSKRISKRSIKVTTVGTSSPGYSVNTGPGGLIMSGSASINNSDVHVNGTIQMSGAARIGSDIVPATVNVANIACPPGNTPGPAFPSLCSSSQPISIPDWSTASIIGTVCATGQTQSKFPSSPYNLALPQIRAGLLGGQGLRSNCTAPPVGYPTYNRANHLSQVTTTGSGTSNTYVCGSWPFNRTWPANLRLTGNVTVDSSCDVTIHGNAHITGNLTLGGAARIRVAESAGSTRPVVIVDGNISVGGASALIPNSRGTGIQFISFRTNASCNPNCTALSGNELKASQGLQTVAISGGVSLPGMVFQSYWGRITVNGAGNIGSAIGQTVDLQGAGTIIFGTGLSSGAKTWSITSYQQVYNVE